MVGTRNRNPREPFASSVAVRKRMQNQRRRDTAPELKLRSELHARGLRYRLHRRIVPGTNRSVDIVFVSARVAVEVMGCFWHGCQQHGRSARPANAWYWNEKIRRNMARDHDTDRRLVADDWQVIRVWEHDNVLAAADRIEAIVRTSPGLRPGEP